MRQANRLQSMQKTEIGLYKRRAAPSRPDQSMGGFASSAHLTSQRMVGYSSGLQELARLATLASKVAKE